MLRKTKFTKFTLAISLAMSLFFLNQKLFFGLKQQKPVKIPIVYHPSYNISSLGLHPFDTCKYKKIHKFLIDNCNLGLTKQSFYKPEIVSDEDLLLVHTQEYLDSLKSSKEILRIAEIEVPVLRFFMRIIPHFIWNRILLTPIKYATGGTALAAELALKYYFAINLSGGYHHARRDHGEGFCYFADIQLAVHKVLEKHPEYKILIVDLDAHQGNGHERDFIDNPNVFVYDQYNVENWPHDYEAVEGIDFEVPLGRYARDKEYLNLLRTELSKAIKKAKPNFIIYNAGTDILIDDRIGKLAISEKGVIERDEIVFKFALENNIPILMLLSGGYKKRSGPVVGESIKNLLEGPLQNLVAQIG